MMAEVENLVLDHLGHLRGQLDRVESDIGEIASTRASPASKSGLISSRARDQTP
jgi:hypothetical protein